MSKWTEFRCRLVNTPDKKGPRPMKSIIHVNQQVIVQNRRNGTNKPPLIVRTYKGVRHAHEIEIAGPSILKNSPQKPLKCGARVWIETTAPVNVVA